MQNVVNKRVIIHVGPPKTGTSAIQHWCRENIVFLSKHGIYYPEHDLDANLISSGNILSICDIKRSSSGINKVSIDHFKVTELIDQFNKSDFSILLLSSEFFLQHMLEIKALVPNAEFIAYLRNPIEIIESNYNQGIKRNRHTKKINFSTFRTFPHASLLIEYESKYKDESLNLRIYRDNQNFDIVCDFLEFLNITIAYKRKNLRINSSYQLEALEYKRWINQFDLGDYYNHKIDRLLQAYNSGTDNFTFIPKDELPMIKSFYLSRIDEIIVKFERFDLSKYRDSVEFYSTPKCYEQSILKSDFIKITQYLTARFGLLAYPFLESIYSKVKSMDSQEPYCDYFIEFYKKAHFFKAKFFFYRLFKKFLRR